MNATTATAGWLSMGTALAAGIVLAAGLGGCHRDTRNLATIPRDVGPQMNEVSGLVFQLEYGAPRTPNAQWRYRGLLGEYHVMDYYGLGRVYDQPEYRYSIRAHKDHLPKDFPKEPQPPVKTTLSKEDELYFERIQEERRREKIRTGETGIVW